MIADNTGDPATARDRLPEARYRSRYRLIAMKPTRLLGADPGAAA
jgi:hypothetical protein